MNVICSAAEAITTWVEVIGMGIGNLSVVWSWISGGWHCCEGILINPAISTVCGPLLSGLGLNAILEACGSVATSIFGIPISQALGGACNTILSFIQSILPM